MDSPVASEGRRTRLAEQRKALPDGPGVYLFRDAKGKVIYVGKAKSIKKRVGQPLLQPGHARRLRDGRRDRVGRVRARRLRGRGAAGRAELHQAVPPALQHPPARRQVLSVHRDLDGRGLPARLLHARAPPPRPRLLRARTRTPSACAARSTCSARSSCSAPARASSPGGARARRAWTTTSSAAGRPASATSRPRSTASRSTASSPSSRGRYREIERDLEAQDEGGVGRAQEFEQAALRAQPPARRALAARAPARRQRGDRDARRRRRRASTAPTPTRRSSRSATACSPTASPSTSRTPPSASVGEVAEEFLLQYYGDQLAIPPQVIVQERRRGPRRAGRGARRSAAARSVEVRAAERGDKRRILELAERNALLALDQERLKAERRRQQRVEALDGLQEALGLDALPLRIECFDISNLMGTHTVASMVVFEGGAPKKSDYRRFNVRGLTRACPTTSPRWRRSSAGASRSGRPSRTSARTTPSATSRSRRCPNLIVIDGGPGQLVGRPARAGGLPRARRRPSSRWPSASRRSSCPAAREPIVLAARHARAAAAAARARRGPPLRDHPPPHAPRPRDDGVDPRRPARASARRASARCWRTSARPRRSSPRRASSSRRCPALPGKTARDIWTHLHRTGD